MPPPNRQPCSANNCDYETPEGIPTWDLLTTHLNTHVIAAHQTATAVPRTSQSKLAKQSRPVVSEDMSEEAWRYFVNEWERYKRQTGIKDQELLDELWCCMNDNLRQLAFSEGGTKDLTNEDLMLTRIKSLAVVSLHPSVHTVNLHGLKQFQNENVHTFAARTRGVAASCNLVKSCTCNAVVNYSEETCFHVVLAGLYDQDMKREGSYAGNDGNN